jgi:hypothetical protein
MGNLFNKGSNTVTSAPNPTAAAAYNQLIPQIENVAATPYQAFTGQGVAPVNPSRFTLVAELAKPLCGQRHVTPALIALRIVVSHLLRQMEDPRETLQMLIADLNAALEQKPMWAN